ncbi:MAG: cation transporter [Candidatus Bathyarchaeota archaeon]|nr:MAG: cation transporter [Candidatus Bathyarchaeota archaeon]
MAEREKRIRLALLLNVCFTAIEIVGGLWTNSLAIISDALHDFGDSVALGSSIVLERASRKEPDASRTFGYQRLSLFSALFSALVLVGGSVVVLLNVVPRLLNPERVDATGMVVFAIIGIMANGLGFSLLKKGESLNEKVLSWHLLEDVLGWVVILIGGSVIHFWDAHFIDPLMTIGITAFLLYNVARNLMEAMNILLQGVPKHINIDEVKRELSKIKGVIAVHDVHIWSLEGETDVFSGHVVVDDALLRTPDETRRSIKEALKKHHIEHSTVELESKDSCSGIECEDWCSRKTQK